jgi:hypothetical protein
MAPVPQLFRSFRTRPRTRSSAAPRSRATVLSVPVTVALALTLGLAACGGKSKSEALPGTVTTPQVLSVKTSVLKVGSVDVESAGSQAAQIDTATGKTVLSKAQAYIDDAVFAPLKSGAVGSGYGALFDAGVQSKATGADEAALTDLGVGKVTKLTTKASTVALSALAGTLNDIMYVATNFNLTLNATTAAGATAITHHVELTFAPSGKTWLVTGYRVLTTRKTATHTTTTTATGGTTP